MTTGNVSSAAFIINNMQTGNISSRKTDTGSQFKDVINSLNDTGNTLTGAGQTRDGMEVFHNEDDSYLRSVHS